MNEKSAKKDKKKPPPIGISFEAPGSGEWVEGVGYVIKNIEIEKVALTRWIQGEGTVELDKGLVIFCDKSGAKFTLQANSLGDGFKRLIDFMKELKKLFYSFEFDVEGFDIFEALLIKYKINLEGL